jgi:hypothetical protein
LDWLLGFRYIPELDYKLNLNKGKSLTFMASVNVEGNMMLQPFDEYEMDGGGNPYRIWARYAGEQYEVRLGLQKIDFGSATILRPLQWFNQMDPRDPLRMTNGVYGALGRYYFLNNANIWAWILYGNEKRRGLDALETYYQHPEFGGRLQYPLPRGEVALSYHHRTARYLIPTEYMPYWEQVPENRIGLDGKWDVEIGLWVEASHIYKTENVGSLTNQTLMNLGADYTFLLGNGLNVMFEQLFMALDEKAFQFNERINFTATSLSYPLGLWGNMSSILYYDWNARGFNFFVNYQRQLKTMTGYLMAFYNSSYQQGVVQTSGDLNLFKGPGLRLMLVYHH